MMGMGQSDLTGKDMVVALFHGQVAQDVAGTAGMSESPTRAWLWGQQPLLTLPPPALQ